MICSRHQPSFSDEFDETDFYYEYKTARNRISVLFSFLGINSESFLNDKTLLKKFFESIIKKGGEISVLESVAVLSEINGKTFHKTLKNLLRRFYFVHRNVQIDKKDMVKAINNLNKLKNFNGTDI